MNDTSIPVEILKLDFSELGSHWLKPGSRKLHPRELAQRPECHERLARFIRRYEVRPFRQSYRSMLALFRQGGASKEDAKDVLKYYFAENMQVLDSYGRGSPFDHVELWGRNGTPIFLIGHPYQVTGDAFDTLNAIRGLGIDVTITTESWYGNGTVQVCVHHHETSSASQEQQKPRRVSASDNGKPTSC